MDHLRQRFEKDLKGKLQIKSSGQIKEDLLLLKAFRYCDSNETGKCDQDMFAQALTKVGFYGYTDTELDKLFVMYSNNEKYLDYKNFVGNLFDNPSLTNQTEEENKQGDNDAEQNEENEEQDLIEIIIMRLRNKLSKEGIANLISIETGFRNIDTENEQELDFSTFKVACEKFNFELTEDECKELFLAFTKEETTKVNYDEFIRILRGELIEKRKNLVENVFKSIDKENKGGLSVDELIQIYNPKGSYEFLYNKENEENSKKIFENTFKENHIYLNGEDGVDKLVDIDEFIDYYESVSLMILEDDTFKEVMLKSWGLMPLDEPIKKEEQPVIKKEEKEETPKKEKTPTKEEKPEEKPEKPENTENVAEEIRPSVENAEERFEKEKEFRKKLLKEQNIDVFRETLAAKGITSVINFLNQLRQYDRKGDKLLSFSDFFDILNNINLHMREKDAKLVFSDFSDGSKMDYSKFLSALVGNSLNDRRNNIVKEAFKRIDVENCGVVNLTEVKSLFNSKNSPLVREGYVTEEDFYNNFMETFQTHHNIFRSAKIKKVNFEEFLDYYKYFSITIDDDYLFEETLIYCWKLSKSKIAHAGPKDNIKKIFENPAPETPSESVVSKNISIPGKNRTAKKCFPVASNETPYGTDTDVTDYSNLLHPKGDLNGIKLNRNEDPMTTLRKRVFSRGPRSIMSLRRTFMLYDDEKNNNLSFKQFNKFVNDFRLNITDEEKKKIFNNFDKNNTETINYTELVKGLVGEMNRYRNKIIEKVFEKLDKENTGKVSFDTIINSYDPYKHPQVLSGERNAQEVLCRFIDLFEYHFNLLNPDKDNEEVTKDEFIEFYNYISACIDDDKYFENVMSRVWGLGTVENYGKMKYSKKNESDFKIN
jgi:Ca2+-binding EF-hand superfamily protein